MKATQKIPRQERTEPLHRDGQTSRSNSETLVPEMPDYHQCSVLAPVGAEAFNYRVRSSCLWKDGFCYCPECDSTLQQPWAPCAMMNYTMCSGVRIQERWQDQSTSASTGKCQENAHMALRFRVSTILPCWLILPSVACLLSVHIVGLLFTHDQSMLVSFDLSGPRTLIECTQRVKIFL